MCRSDCADVDPCADLVGVGAGGPDPLKNYKATKPAFNVGPSLGR